MENTSSTSTKGDAELQNTTVNHVEDCDSVPRDRVGKMILLTGVHQGRPWEVSLHPLGYLQGYIRVPEGHALCKLHDGPDHWRWVTSCCAVDAYEISWFDHISSLGGLSIGFMTGVTQVQFDPRFIPSLEIPTNQEYPIISPERAADMCRAYAEFLNSGKVEEMLRPRTSSMRRLVIDDLLSDDECRVGQRPLEAKSDEQLLETYRSVVQERLMNQLDRDRR